MGLVTKIEAAIRIGIGMELLEYCCVRCPKPKQTRVLAVVNTAQGDMIDEKELNDFHTYLHSPWPLPPKGDRPYLPDIVKEDIRQECHYSCAICGHMDNGEVAHIKPVADTLNNGPDNLIYLCPNHHTKYDLGYAPAANITEQEIMAAKLMKRNSRQRMMKHEGNVTKVYRVLLSSIAKIKEKIEDLPSKNLVSIYETEANTLMGLLSEMTEQAQEYASKDLEVDVAKKVLIEKAPAIAKATLGLQPNESGKELRSRMTQMAEIAKKVLIDLDEAECPRCGGRGVTGVVKDYCAYCKGSCFVTKKEAEEYDPEEIDEVECPHCGGIGTIGLNQHWCPVCRGSCFVSRDDAELYDENEIDEVDCPHCNGSGQLGYDQHYCPFCKGACRITNAEAAEYDEDKIDEVECPHCNGRGTRGLVGDECKICLGACVVPASKAQAYRDRYPDR